MKVHKQQKSDEQHLTEVYPIAFSELVTYIYEKKVESDSATPRSFKLAELTMMYKERLEQLGVDLPKVHATRLKEQLLEHIPKLKAYPEGRDIRLAFEGDIASILAHASKYGEAIHFAKAATMIRRDMLNHKSHFSNIRNNTDLEQVVPPSLLQFVCMIEHGADIKSQLQHGASKSDLAMS